MENKLFKQYINEKNSLVYLDYDAVPDRAWRYKQTCVIVYHTEENPHLYLKKGVALAVKSWDYRRKMYKCEINHVPCYMQEAEILPLIFE